MAPGGDEDDILRLKVLHVACPFEDGNGVGERYT